MTPSKKSIRTFQQTIFDWWKKNKRSLPWRSTRDPYKIMVSEVMLQQTGVRRVIPKYAELVEAYPTVTALARAKTGAVLRLWKGMGYNRRALYLHQAAKIISRKFNNQFPISEQLLSGLPGIGKYTARAILVFSFKQDIAMVDTNIRKIITHFFFSDKKQSEKIIQNVADRLLPKGRSWEWHQALMDYGAMNTSEWRHPERSRRVERKKTVPFNESTRFYRGRIMDLLREKEWREEALLQELVKNYKKPASFFRERIASLIKDDLAVQKGNAIRLPL